MITEQMVEALRALLDEAENFSVSGVYFTEPCFKHKGPALAHAALEAAAALSQKAEGEAGAWPLGTHAHIDHDGFSGTVIGHYQRQDGYQGCVLQQDGSKVVHVYGLRHLQPAAPLPRSPQGADRGVVETCIIAISKASTQRRGQVSPDFYAGIDAAYEALQSLIDPKPAFARDGIEAQRGLNDIWPGDKL